VTGQWRVPAGMRGDPRLVRIGTGVIREADLTCPSRFSVKARPAIQARIRPSKQKTRLENFALGPVMEALGDVELKGMSIEVALDRVGERAMPVHPGVRAFTRHAVRTYLGSGRRRALIPCRIRGLRGRTPTALSRSAPAAIS
jgi:hypothetical protein